MHISKETPEQTIERLRHVIQLTQLQIFHQAYCFKELVYPLQSFHTDALAYVKDENRWSCLIPSKSESKEQYVIFSFHFPENIDNSGFVGFLAQHIKNETGSGVFVVCGYNSEKGGIYDYWGCPIAVADKVIEVVLKLMDNE